MPFPADFKLAGFSIPCFEREVFFSTRRRRTPDAETNGLPMWAIQRLESTTFRFEQRLKQ
jgi:hypothetical protein